ncbi:MAG: SUMF1/EgtB/PvdO family nonheme iron enzyme [bacterium]
MNMYIPFSIHVALALSLFAQQGVKPQKEPEFLKMNTWAETLVSNREALLKWETRLDAQAGTNNTEKFGAGALYQRAMRRRVILVKALSAFPDPTDQLVALWEIEGNIWLQLPDYTRALNDWLPGESAQYFKSAYQAASVKSLQEFKTILSTTDGIKAKVLEPRKKTLETWCESVRVALAADKSTDQARHLYYQLCEVKEMADLATRLASMRLAVNDQRAMFKSRYPQAEVALRDITERETCLEPAWKMVLSGHAQALNELMVNRQAIHAIQSKILLNTPLLAFDKLLLTKGDINFASNWSGPNTIGNELCVLSPVTPSGKLTTIHKGAISDYDLHWDGNHVLFSDRKTLWELDLVSTNTVPRRVSMEKPDIAHYDGCYLPDGKIVSACTACYQAVPCTGQPDVGNLHVMDANGKNERRITYDQDHDWNPTVMQDGRVLYTRWEYADIPHYFSRFLMRMNPDGSGQMEYYGSGSYWPNAMYWPRPIPGDPNAVVCIVSGHHGVSRVGELIILDPSKGRKEANGVVQRIPGYGQKVEPIIMDRLIERVWPRFAAPYPLAEPGSNLGAGKYFLACVKRNEFSSWDLCLVDIFDNITPILTAANSPDISPWSSAGYMTPVPLRVRPVPPVIPSALNPAQPDGVIYLADIYRGEGLRGYPRGSIKALRIGTHHYRYYGNGATYSCSFEGGWDIKRILGTVPVNPDGTAFFRVPANTPIFVQPLDAEGKAQQQMRSWYTAMPGETAACVGCHEPQNSVPSPQVNRAVKGKPSEIAPWNGAARGISFEHDIQPILNQRCVGCHNDTPYAVNGKHIPLEDFRDKRIRPPEQKLIPNKCSWWGWLGPANKHLQKQPDCFSPSYMRFQKYVRRAGYEADLHMLQPAEFDADTSVLVQMLKKGHQGVTLTSLEWEAIYTWIDFNVPYCGTWRESNLPPNEEHVKQRAAYKKLYSGLDDRDEKLRPVPPIAPFQPPKPEAAKPSGVLTVPGWPMTAEQAVAAQKASGAQALTLDLGADVKMKFALIPSGQFVMGRAHGFMDEAPQTAITIDKAFYMGTMEVTCAQYAQFDSHHENGYIEGRGKDRVTRGTDIGTPEHPVVRISWNDALAFCDWLSKKSGKVCTLPTEAQWEWACRAGTATDFPSGTELGNHQANIADENIRDWNYGRAQNGYTDGAPYSTPGGRYTPNAWGLFDMHGNVSEWTLSAYRPYPYSESGGKTTDSLKVIRGGSWNDTMKYVSSASRWRYPAHQPVYNVGFRVLIQK